MSGFRKRSHEIGPLFTAVAHAEKYQSKNPISRYLIKNFMREILNTVAEAGASNVYEIGCGEGHILGMLANNNYSVRGCDISESSLLVARQEAKKNRFLIPLEKKSIYELEPSVDKADTIICCEVLEHLTDPETAIQKLVSITDKNLILSVPREPLWHVMNMARGKYWHALGNTPGHYQHWTKKMFIDFVSDFADIVSVKTPTPWTLIHCKPKN